MAKKTLYQVLHVNTTAAPEVIKAAYEARMAALKDNAAPEVAAERIFIREAYELLADPVRKKLYDEKLREQFRSLSGGGMEEARPRPANARLEHVAEPSPGFSRSWIGSIALLLAVGVIGAWVWLDPTSTRSMRYGCWSFSRPRKRAKRRSRPTSYARPWIGPRTVPIRAGRRPRNGARKQCGKATTGVSSTSGNE